MIDIRNVDLNLLVALDALLDERSVTKAAKRLAMSQPALSHGLKRLRRLFGDPLFVRTQRGLRPTPRAVSLAAPLKAIMRRTEALLQPSDFDPATAEGNLTISTTDYLQVAVVMPFLRAFRAQAPRMTLSIRSAELSELPARMARGGVDLGITVAQFASPDLLSRYLYTDRYVCAVRKSHPAAGGLASVDDFCRYDHVLIAPTGGALQGPTDEGLAALGRKRSVAISVPNFLILPHLLRVTDLIAVAPERLLRGLKRDFAVFEAPLAMPTFDVIMVWHPRLHADPQHRWVRGLVGSVIRGT